MKSINYKDLLVCPMSGESLLLNDNCFISVESQNEYPIKDGKINFKLNKEKKVNLNITLNKTSSKVYNFEIKDLIKNTSPEIDFSIIKTPYHLSEELISYFPKPQNDNSFVLDLGCGTGLHKDLCEFAGYNYVGLDYNSKQADILGDAHSLPFKDNSFEFIISIAVIEHIQHPYLMMQEVNRVLKPGGTFIGTVSFLEPFHDNSFYHHTHLGVLNSLEVGGFEKLKISRIKKWDGITAIFTMHLFSTLNKNLIFLLILPIKILHKIWWFYKRIINPNHYHPFAKHYMNFPFAGSFCFIAKK